MAAVIIIIIVVGGQSWGEQRLRGRCSACGGSAWNRGASRQPEVDLEDFGHWPHSKPSPPGCFASLFTARFLETVV